MRTADGEETWASGVPDAPPRTRAGLLVSSSTPAGTQASGLLRAPLLGPATLALLVTVTFPAFTASAHGTDGGSRAAPDGGTELGSAVPGGPPRDLSTPSSVGHTPGDGTGFVGLGLRMDNAPRVLDPADAHVQGDVDRELIRRVMHAHNGQWRYCASTALQGDAGVAAITGRVTVAFTIGEKGDVTTASVAESTVVGGELGGCLVKRVKTVTFPKPPKGRGAVGVRWPFRFELAAP